MAGITAHGASFTFSTFAGDVTAISVETPSAEVVDMTGMSAPLGNIVMVPSGDIAGGSITVDFLARRGAGLPQSFVKQRSALTFASAEFSYSVNVICESASLTAQSGDLIKGSLRFRPTDYYGS